jgi:hypothetical protein
MQILYYYYIYYYYFLDNVRYKSKYVYEYIQQFIVFYIQEVKVNATELITCININLIRKLFS